MRIQLPERARPSTQTTVWNLCFDRVFNDYELREYVRAAQNGRS